MSRPWLSEFYRDLLRAVDAGVITLAEARAIGPYLTLLPNGGADVRCYTVMSPTVEALVERVIAWWVDVSDFTEEQTT